MKRPTVHGVPVVPWVDLRRYLHTEWHQGEHVTLVAPTGQGKTHLLKQLLPIRGYVVTIATKPKDPSLDALRRSGFDVIRSWPPKRDQDRVLLWPRIDSMSDVAQQRQVIGDALRSIYTEGGWCVATDETRYLSTTLGLQDELELLWLQGRSMGVSLVSATQRPRWLPLEAFNQATHLFLWRNGDKYDRDRLAALGTVDTAKVARVIADLPRYTFLYVNTRTDELAVSRAPAR